MTKDIFNIGHPPIKDKVHNNNSLVIEEPLTPADGGEDYISSNFEIKKIKWLFIIAVALISVIFGRIGYLQIVKGTEHRLAAEENRIRISEIKAPRGIIYDTNNEILAHNIPNFILTFTPADLTDDPAAKEAIIRRIADILIVNVNEIQNIINSPSPYTYKPNVIQDHIPYDQAILLKIAAADMPGITLNVSTFREYLTGEAFSHLLGYMGKISPDELAYYPDYSYDDYVGKSGLELFYETELRGTSGKKEIEVNSLGKESKIITESKPILGDNIQLTIDKNLQQALYDSIKNTVQKSSTATGGVAIAQNPSNGEILALVSFPAFNNNDFTVGLTQESYQEIINDPNKPLFNRSVAGEYPSGSTIKPAIALAALEEGIINEYSTFLSTGGIQIDKWFFPDWKAGGHGQTDVKKAIAESVNTFFYIIGGGNETVTGLGIDRLKYYLELFGLNSILGIDLPGEASGFLPNKEWKEEAKNEPWYIGDTYHLSIGQGDILVTPLQIANYTSIIANGGTLYKPHLVKALSDSHNEIIKNIDPEISNDNFIADSYFQVVKQGLRQAILSGSSRALADLPFSAAGKTGTAQFGNQGKTHAWFTCFAPYENPEIVITVLIEAGGEGHTAALPIAKSGLLEWFKRNE